MLRREGTRFVDSGHFSIIAGRWMFQSDRSEQSLSAGEPEDAPVLPTRVRVLENLALQRVVHAIRRDRSDNQWSVRGRLTEFDGQNFLHIETLSRVSRSN